MNYMNLRDGLCIRICLYGVFVPIQIFNRTLIKFFFEVFKSVMVDSKFFCILSFSCITIKDVSVHIF